MMKQFISVCVMLCVTVSNHLLENKCVVLFSELSYGSYNVIGKQNALNDA